MEYSVKFGGVELGNYIEVLHGFTLRNGALWQPAIRTINDRARGARIDYTTYQYKTIPMPFEISGNVQSKYDSLVRALNVDKPTELIFEELPERVFYAIPSGDLQFDDFGFCGSGTITWVVPDGVAYSVTKKTAKNNDGGKTITLINNGTETTPVDIKVTMKSDNGYIGFALGDRVYQIGNPEELDGESSQRTEMLFDDHLNRDRGWTLNNGITPPVTPTRDQNGTIKYVEEETNEGYATVSNYASGEYWHGASLTKNVPADRNGRYAVNWRSDFRYDFNTDGASNKGVQVGHNSVTWSDKDGKIICAIVFEDNSPSEEQSDMYIYVEENRVMALKNAGKKFYDTQRGGGNHVRVEKVGDQISFGFESKDINKSYQLSRPDAELRKITWYGAAYKSHTPIQNNLLRALNVYKHNVDRYEDIPNYFTAGDVAEISGTTGDVFINDVFNMDVVDIASQPLLLPPGRHTLGIVVSSFAQIPEVEVSFRERWL